MFRYLIALFSLASVTLSAGIDPSVKFKPVHEALITQITALAPIEVISRQPPAPRADAQPAQPSPQMIWIPGYWAFDKNAGDFVWICGIWRLPPDNHSWVPGFWKQENGWFWVGGYWAVNGSNPVYSQKAPPSQPRENAGNPPNNDHFWAPGYWSYDRVGDKFNWLGGSWQRFDDNFVFVPAWWQWRPEGYLFHPAFWDWKLNDRGIAYDCEGRGALVPLTEQIIISRIYYWYPNYHLFFWFHWHCCHDFWIDCWCLPPWWGWNGWWALGWGDSWWLWWWWSHPGFPPPPWLWPFLLNQLLGPVPVALNFMENAPWPLFMAPNGVPSLDDWLDAIEGITGNRNPLLPQGDHNDAAEQAGENLPDTDPEQRPEGQTKPDQVTPPQIGDTVRPDGIAPIPRTPSRPPAATAPVPSKPETQATPPATITPPSSWGQPERPYQPYQPRPRRPINPDSWQPPTRRPIYPPSDGWKPPSQRPDRTPSYPPSQSTPNYPPSQSKPTYPPTQSTPNYPPTQSKPTYPPTQSTPRLNYQPMQRLNTDRMQRFQQQQRTFQPQQTQPSQKQRGEIDY